MKISKSPFYVLFLSSLCFLSGCQTIGSVVVRSVERAVTGKSSSPRPVSRALEKQLTPINSGPGLLVCEPQSSLADQNFAKGCGRWLFLQAAGQGPLGQTPVWGVMAEARRALKLSTLQLDKKNALAACKLGGTTHIATGQLEGSSAAQKLTYQVWKSDGTAAGAPLFISGSREKIVQQLPLLARKINAQANGAQANGAQANGAQANGAADTKTQIAPCELKAEELALVGRAAWKPLKWLDATDATARKLKTLAPRSTLASLLLWRNTKVSKAESENLFSALAPQISRNTLVLSDFSRHFSYLTGTHEKALANLLAQYPSNHLLHSAQRAFFMANGAAARSQARQSAEMSVRAASHNYLAWYELGQCLSTQAEDIRQSRYSSQMSFKESRQVHALYPLWLEAQQKAAALNPLSGFCWSDLSTAAVFNGDMVLADNAIAKALSLDALDGEAYNWALQMNLPKWGGNRVQFFNYANKAIANAAKMDMPTKSLFEGYRAYGLTNQIGPMANQLVAANPRDAVALYESAAILHYQQRDYAKAEPLYRKVLAINPQHARCLSSLADLQTWVHGDNKAAEALYRKAIAADANDGFHHANLARLLNRTGRRAAADTELAKARALGFRAAHPVWSEMGVRP